MSNFIRIGGIFVVLGLTSAAWVILGGLTKSRSTDYRTGLGGEVEALWGRAQVQRPPGLAIDGAEHRSVHPSSSHIDVTLHSDARRKGLVWYPLYDVGFAGQWSYVHQEPWAGTLELTFELPDRTGTYDDFSFKVDDREYAGVLNPEDGTVTVKVPVAPQQERTLSVAYASRGMETWSYQAAQGAEVLQDFHLAMTTDFAEIDFPGNAMSPSSRRREGSGWALGWDFTHVVTGHSIGMVMPKNIQPGELASSLSLSAPISLLFFFGIIYIITLVRKIDIHPVNYFMIAASFFSFHLLFAYMVDHVAVVPAFAVASGVSMALLVSYLRLVVSSTFAYREAALAHLVYLVGFSMAHFWEGFTGLTVTVMGILTLFVVMQLTGRIRWSEVFKRTPAPTFPARPVAVPHGPVATTAKPAVAGD